MTICREVIGNLSSAQEHRPLSPGELQLMGKLKEMLLGLAAIQKSRDRHASRLT
jgi:hypothetical protein